MEHPLSSTRKSARTAPGSRRSNGPGPLNLLIEAVAWSWQANWLPVAEATPFGITTCWTRSGCKRAREKNG
jgi:hypothetical protein